MGDPFAARNFGWSESSGSEVSSGLFIEESDSDSLVSEDDEAPFARHGPVLDADHENVDMQCEFWSHCAFGFILDYKKFSIAYPQQLINSAWRIRGVAIVVGRDSFFYLIHFGIFLENNNKFQTISLVRKHFKLFWFLTTRVQRKRFLGYKIEYFLLDFPILH